MTGGNHPIRAACRLAGDTCLSNLLGMLGQHGRIVAADLRTGSWQSHALARQLGDQLDLPFDHVFASTARIADRPDQAGRIVAALIDREAAGNDLIRASHSLAKRLAAAACDGAFAAILLLAPTGEHGWMPEDIWLFHFLLRMLQDAPVDLVVAVSDDASALPWGLPWVEISSARGPTPMRRDADPARPGLVPPSALAEEGGPACLPLEGGWALLLPSERAPRQRGTDADRLDPPWLRAYRETLQPAASRDRELLSAAAADLFGEGGYRQAVNLLTSAQEGQQGAAWASLESQAQAMRIAAMDFRAAAERPDPDPALPDVFVRELSASKAWGLVMSGRCAEAEPLFARACALADKAPPDAMSLYLRNIAALNKLRLGKIEDAFEIEHAIERTLRSFDRPEWHVAYINAINLARLYRYRRDFTAAGIYYRQAFAISEGGRSEDDAVYLNLCQSWIEEAEGALAQALLAMLRSAIHWLSMAVPEALAPRVAQAMHAKPGFGLVAAVSDDMGERLRKLLGQIGSPFDQLIQPTDDAEPPAWRRADGLYRDATAVGGAGWGMLSRPRLPDDPRVHPEQRDLAVLVGRLLAALGGGPAVGSGTCLAVDDCFGTEIPVNRETLLDLALRHGCRRLVYQGKEISLSQADADAAVAQCVIAPGPGVDAIARGPEGAVITFRRSRPPLIVSDFHLGIVEAARRRENCAQIAEELPMAIEELIPFARQLEQAGVLALRTPPAAHRVNAYAAAL